MIAMSPRDSLIVALDLDGRRSLELARSIAHEVRWVKVGMTLYYQEGPHIIEHLRGMGFDVFLDLKLHDIPHQVQGAAHVAAALGVGMLTVHAAGGEAMIAAAVEGATQGAADAGIEVPAVLAVTVLTSMDEAVLGSIGVEGPVLTQVDRLARLARRGGASGVVCSPREAAQMRTTLGEDAYIVTPGVRPAGADVGDQSRVATPEVAIRSGASHIVIGRPISAAPDAPAAVREILTQIEGTTEWPSR